MIEHKDFTEKRFFVLTTLSTSTEVTKLRVHIETVQCCLIERKTTTDYNNLFSCLNDTYYN